MTRVTVIGGGYGGIAIAKALDDVAEVTLVEQKDTFVNHTAALRAAVDREWAERIFLPYDNLLARGRVVHGTALGVRGTTVSVAGMGDIEADHLVLATGTAYPFPAKHLESSSIIFEITGSDDKVTAFLKVIKPYGIVEVIRTGLIALERGEHTIYEHCEEREYYGKNLL